MQVVLFAAVSSKSNPYIALLRQAVQPYWNGSVTVHLRFSPGWVLRHGRAGTVAHLHWIENHLRPRPWFKSTFPISRQFVNRLGNNRLSRPVRATGMLAKLALALVLARRAGVRVVYTVHNLMAHHNRNDYYFFLRSLANRLIFRQADAVHVHSHYAAEAIARLYGRRRNVFIVPHGNYIGWYANTVSRTEARLILNLPNEAFVYLFLGQIAPYKGLEDLIRAFIALDDPSTRLVIAGKVARTDYGAQIAKMTQHPRVLYRPGFVPDEQVQVYFNAADIMAVPYQRITTSGSALLAFSFGCPVIAPALGALPEVVPPLAGLLYNPDEPGALKAALQRTQHIPWSSQAVLAHARQFDWEVIGALMANIYRTTLLANQRAIPSQEAHT